MRTSNNSTSNNSTSNNITGHHRPPTGNQQDAVTYQRMLDALPESEVGLARELCLEAMAKGHYQACKKWLG